MWTKRWRGETPTSLVRLGVDYSEVTTLFARPNAVWENTSERILVAVTVHKVLMGRNHSPTRSCESKQSLLEPICFGSYDLR